MDTVDTVDTATWDMLDTVVLLHMLTPLDPTSLMLSSMFPMVMLLLVSTALLMLELFTLPRDPLMLTLSTDTEDTDTLDLLPLDFPPCPMLASLFRDMLKDTNTDCGRLQDVGIYCLINTTDKYVTFSYIYMSPLGHIPFVSIIYEGSYC